jgi:3',5'-cyclic AMP phosphodiesterase CpdA
MSTVKIAHLSDPHFNQNKDFEIWQQVCDFINNTVEPHVILITGDITDNAERAEFKCAKQQLSSLKVKRGNQIRGDDQNYRIIPGNHDRFVIQGNALFGLTWQKDKSARFDHTFQGVMHVTPTGPCDLELGVTATDPGWNIRVIGLDSSEDDKWFAQGAVKQTSIAGACRCATLKSDRDLVIVLVHHHVLPVPEVEMRREKSGLSAVADVTGFLNSGILLDGLSRSHVNLVLHGHEHCPNQARFRSVSDLSSEVVVLAAGSATGEETGDGWDLSRVHFNVLELRDDRSIWLQEVKGAATGLGYASSRPTLLLAAEDIRRSCFLRRKRGPRNEGDQPQGYPRGALRSRLRKRIEFTLDRDIEITETRTEWAVENKWNQLTRNASGAVSQAAIVKFEWQEGTTPEVLRGYFIRDAEEPEIYRLGLPLSADQSIRKALRVTSRWTWEGGAVLTRREWISLPAKAKGWFRAEGKEFAGISVADDQEYEALTLTVRIPERFAPDSKKVKLWYVKPGDRTPYPAVGLQKSLEFCGTDTIELHIPFPLPGYLYVLSWPLSDVNCVGSETDAFTRAAASHSNELIEVAANALKHEAWFTDASVGLYVLEDGKDFMLKRLASLGAQPQDRLNLKDANSVGRVGWWRRRVLPVSQDGDNEQDFMVGEKLLAMVPIRSREDEVLGHEAVGILRIGLKSDPGSIPGDRTAAEVWRERFSANITEAAHSVLQKARSCYGGGQL